MKEGCLQFRMSNIAVSDLHKKWFTVISSVISFKKVERDHPAGASIQYSISDHYLNPSSISTIFLLLTLSSLVFQFFPQSWNHTFVRMKTGP